jgi:zinc-ribbon domain
MASRYCPKCGAPNSPSAAFCQYCGAALPAATSSPLSSGPAAGVPPPPSWGTPPPGGPSYAAPPYGATPYGTPAYGPPPPARPGRRLWVYVIVGIVVFFVVIAAIGFFLIPAAPAINVSEITFLSTDNACGLANSDWEGFTGNSSQVFYIGFDLNGTANSTSGGTDACMITTVSAVTAGFSVSGANVPLSIPRNATETLQFNLTCPSSSFNGVLDLSVT